MHSSLLKTGQLRKRSKPVTVRPCKKRPMRSAVWRPRGAAVLTVKERELCDDLLLSRHADGLELMALCDDILVRQHHLLRTCHQHSCD